MDTKAHMHMQGHIPSPDSHSRYQQIHANKWSAQIPKYTYQHLQGDVLNEISYDLMVNTATSYVLMQIHTYENIYCHTYRLFRYVCK